MKNQGIIFHGADKNMVLERAYNFAIEYMLAGKECHCTKKHIYANTHPNFLLIKKQDDENEISIEDGRKVIEFLSHRPSLRGKRAVIISDFEDTSHNAANSILKILEEPPIDSILILTTTKFQSILPTVRSRCIKERVSRSFLSATNFESAHEFVRAVLKDVDRTFIENVVNFIETKRPNKIEFSKQNAENLEKVLDVLILHYSFLCSKENGIITAEKIFTLQSFARLIRNTYPDKQAAIIAAYEMVNR
ncbi:MAG: hypothetical protein LBB34_02410 [Holosporales bacterium]|jgi:DNA polymerase III delta prime subunit|nr:hypothetical protein [Holosporales bacterium]